MTDMQKNLLEQDDAKVDALIMAYPERVPVKAIAEFLGCAPDTVRAWIQRGGIGLFEQKIGKQNRVFIVPTAQFVRWYRMMRD